MIKKNINPFQRFPDHILIFIILYYSRCGICLNTDTINSTLVLRDSDTIVSAGNQFTLGFFTPNGTTTNTTKRYMGIWYSVSQASPAWVANRNNPLNDSLGTIAIHSNGHIILMNGNRDIVWSTNATLSNNSTIMNSTAQLLDTGNLVLTDTSTGSTIWESHEHPVDSYLATMRFSHNPRTGARTDLNSWRTFRDPGRGNFTAGIYAVGVPQYFIWGNGVPRWRSGPWNGRTFTGVSGMNSVYDNGYSISTEADGTYYFTRNFRQGYLSRHYLNADGFLVRGVWDERRSNWNETWVVPDNDCNLYNKCGQNAVCDTEASPICSCLRGYEPRDRREWDRGTWSGGCARQTLLQCERPNNATDRNREDGFLRLTLIKVPDFMQRSSGAEAECASMCLTNCSCLAYAHDTGIGCMFWYENLIDVQKFPATIGSYFYVRVAYSEMDKGKSNKTVVTVTVITSLVAALICLFLVWWTYKRKGKIWTFKGGKGQSDLSKNMLQSDKDKVNIELPLYSFKTLESATCNFALVNRLGAGGFGPVYKGKLENEREVAVKRLSTTSGQGSEEFMNEVVVISKLQHRNLVRLLGCCVEKEEKMLIYEYLSNKSLDVHLSDKEKNVLDWKKRLNIMEGIGRGLQYLHRDSRLRIIHRDLKPSNILLDENWTPKISDFGMARIFGGNQDQANTGKVVGTYGYMAPEYALGGHFSEKSDVFSFGVLVLEIISGIRNTSFYNEEFSLGLLGYTWKLWKEDNAGDMVDKRISNNISFQTEIMRCIHIGLLCVQEFPANRPSISNVLMMLCSEIVDLPAPEHPGFTDRWNRTNVGSTPSTRTCSVNTISNTVLDGR